MVARQRQYGSAGSKAIRPVSYETSSNTLIILALIGRAAVCVEKRSVPGTCERRLYSGRSLARLPFPFRFVPTPWSCFPLVQHHPFPSTTLVDPWRAKSVWNSAALIKAYTQSDPIPLFSSLHSVSQIRNSMILPYFHSEVLSRELKFLFVQWELVIYLDFFLDKFLLHFIAFSSWIDFGSIFQQLVKKLFISLKICNKRSSIIFFFFFKFKTEREFK